MTEHLSLPATDRARGFPDCLMVIFSLWLCSEVSGKKLITSLCPEMIFWSQDETTQAFQDDL